MRVHLPKFLWSLIAALTALPLLSVYTPIAPTGAQPALTRPGNIARTEAQTCSRVVLRALDAVDTACSALGRNNACYGYPDVVATFNEPQPVDFFADVGDRAPVRELQTVRTSPLDLVEEEWGIAVLSVQANLPDTLPGQNAIFLLLGDTKIESVTPSGIALAESGMPTASSGDISAFYLRTGIGQLTCARAPNALIIQGPENIRLQLTVNGAHIEFGSTIVLRTIPFTDIDLQTLQAAGIDPAVLGGALQIAVLDGEAVVRVGGANVQTIRAGETSLICLDADQNLGVDGQTNDAPVTEVCGGWTLPRPLTFEESESFTGLEAQTLNYPITIPPVAADAPTGASLPSVVSTVASAPNNARTSVPGAVATVSSAASAVPEVVATVAGVTTQIPDIVATVSGAASAVPEIVAPLAPGVPTEILPSVVIPTGVLPTAAPTLVLPTLTLPIIDTTLQLRTRTLALTGMGTLPVLPTLTVSLRPSVSFTNTATRTRTVTATPTMTLSRTATPTITRITPSALPTLSPTLSSTFRATVTVFPTTTPSPVDDDDEDDDDD